MVWEAATQEVTEKIQSSIFSADASGSQVRSNFVPGDMFYDAQNPLDL
jgi:hypothetical protein